MSAIGSLVFCTDCGNLLPRGTGEENLECEVCGAFNKDTSEKLVVTRSHPKAFPSSLRTKKSSVQQVDKADMTIEAEIDQTCPECNNPRMKFYTLQLRSADEGATVFYRCEKCGHRFNTNN